MRKTIIIAAMVTILPGSIWLPALAAPETRPANPLAPRIAPIDELRRKAEGGDAEAMKELGLAYRTGAGIDADEKRSMEWLLRAADKGNADAMFHIGITYIVTDKKLAAQWWERAGAAGHGLAAYFVSGSYERGDGVPKDAVKAEEWLQKSAKLGCELAQFDIKRRT